MVSYRAKLDRRTKQHTQSGVSTSDGSRDIAATKSWRKKRKKKKDNKANWMVSNSAKLNSRTKQHTHLESLRVTVPEISWRQNRGGKKEKNKKNKKITKRIGW